MRGEAGLGAAMSGATVSWGGRGERHHLTIYRAARGITGELALDFLSHRIRMNENNGQIRLV